MDIVYVEVPARGRDELPLLSKADVACSVIFATLPANGRKKELPVRYRV